MVPSDFLGEVALFDFPFLGESLTGQRDIREDFPSPRKIDQTETNPYFGRYTTLDPIYLLSMRLISLFSLVAILSFVACSDSSEQNTEQAEDQVSISLDSESDGESVKKVAALSLSEMESAESQYLVPSPGEVLSSLDKLDRVPWSQLASYDLKADYDDKYARALNLGVRVADAFMAVNAEDAGKFGEMSTIIFDLAREIGLGDVLESQRSELDNLASQGKWEELKAALDNVQTDVKDEVQAMGEDELIVLASIGGWIEGMAAVTAHLEENYSAENATLLQQQELVAYFLQKLESMQGPAKEHPLVVQSETTLSAVLPMIEGESVPTMEQTKRIHEQTQTLVARIEAGQ